jgi:hypothetical protein
MRVSDKSRAAAEQGTIIRPLGQNNQVFRRADRGVKRRSTLLVITSRGDPPYLCPASLAIEIRTILQRFRNPLPKSVPLPAEEAVVTGVPGAIAGREVAPGGAGPLHPEDAIDDAAVVLIRTATTVGRIG